MVAIAASDLRVEGAQTKAFVRHSDDWLFEGESIIPMSETAFGSHARQCGSGAWAGEQRCAYTHGSFLTHGWRVSPCHTQGGAGMTEWQVLVGMKVVRHFHQLNTHTHTTNNHLYRCVKARVWASGWPTSESMKWELQERVTGAGHDS